MSRYVSDADFGAIFEDRTKYKGPKINTKNTSPQQSCLNPMCVSGSLEHLDLEIVDKCIAPSRSN